MDTNNTINNNKTKKNITIIKVSANYINQRIDNFLLRELKNVPKSLIYRLMRKGAIRVNGKRVKPEYKVLLNDEVKLPSLDGVDLEAKERSKTDTQVKPSLIKLLQSRIIYECNDFLILNKPSGMAVHAGSRIKSGIIDILRAMYGKQYHIELVHRLDRETSGCLLIAKNRLALNDLSSAFREGNIQKTYLALVSGVWSNSKRIIDLPLRRSVLQGGERMVTVDRDLGKPSQTKVQIKSTHKGTSLLQLEPVTGRTHQIRVHLAHEGHAILGDNKYGNKELNKQLKQDTNLNRMFLHAFSLEFHWGKGGKTISVTAPLDKDLEATLTFYKYL